MWGISNNDKYKNQDIDQSLYFSISFSSNNRNFFVKKNVLNYATFILKRQRGHLEFTYHTWRQIYYPDYWDSLRQETSQQKWNNLHDP